MTLALYRIDDRLIHGQVVVGWGQPLNASFIVLVDDEVSSSDWEQDLYRMGVPPQIEVIFASVDQAAAQLSTWEADERVGILLVGDIDTAVALAQRAPQVRSFKRRWRASSRRPARAAAFRLSHRRRGGEAAPARGRWRRGHRAGRAHRPRHSGRGIHLNLPLDVLIALMVWGTLVGVDLVSLPQMMIARPIVAGAVTGAILGDIATGLKLGVMFELLQYDILPVGAVRYPEYGPATVAAVATAHAATGVLDWGLGRSWVS
jgi:hypothetical protein